ncbi:amidohydrolase family protein [Ekhidna sp. MALMAid0563]|uniref:amidohydrolase family protein n=1 Tax=Ekhidna sp. MALMAid0563 TaxID=3143937 RepID=UPI0032DE3C23
MQKCDSLVRSVCMLFLIGVMPLIGLAQDSDLKPVTNKYAIKNATIVQAPGKTIQNGTILIENGIIKAVGSSLAIPADAWVVDADSMFVYAGFISGLSNIGVEKPKEEEQKDDRKLTGNPTYKRAGITPGSSAREMLKPNDKSVEDFRKLGFTASHSVPHNGMLPGTGTIILLGGEDGESMVVKDQTSMFSQLSGAGGVYPNTVIGVMAKYRDLYRKTSQARDYENKYNSNPNGMERPATDATLQALYPVVSKQMTVAFKAEGVKDIMRVIALQKDLGFKMMLGEVKQGWDAIPTIKPTGAPVFLSLDLPEWKQEEEKNKEDKEEEGDEKSEEKEPTESELEEKALKERQNVMIKNYYTQPGKFRSNGIKFGFSTMEVKSKDFKTNLLKVIENGLTQDQALAALTTEPASILGVSSQMGTIEAGKMANLIVSDTAYFTKDANVRFVFVDGVKYEYEAKKKKKSNGDEAVDASGVWNYTTETPQGNGSGVITIKGTPDDYSGTITVSFNGSTNEIENVVIDGNNVSFSFKLNMGEEITVDISMDIDGDTFEGTLSVAAFGSFPMEGSREPNK